MPQGAAVTRTATRRDAGPGTWEELMAASQAGDRRAYGRLLREVTPLLRAIARRRIRNPAEAEDAVQDALLAIHATRHAYDPRRPLRPWIAAIAERRCIDRLRRLGRHVAERALPPEDLAAPADPCPEHRGERAVAGLPLAEASRWSGLRVNALKIATFRAVRAIRARFSVAREARPHPASAA